MIKKYNHKAIEKKWKRYWQSKKIFKASDPSTSLRSAQGKPKQYILDMFPYPSGAGLHVGHPKGYIATDVVSRMRMMQGYNVLHPMGWDAFGLPAENYAIKNKVHPSVATAKNVKTFKKQLELLGFTYDWSREINTTDPNYYKWTQWIFLQMFKRGLAYESNEPINWCPSCKTGLANEDLEDGKCERCGSVVEQKPLRQWVLKITDYAERLLKDLDLLDKWPEPIKEMQRNWIGRSEGINFKHKVKDLGIEFECYDSIPQTFLAQTFVIIAPEHPLVEKLVRGTDKEKSVMDFVEKIKAKKVSKKFDIETDMEGIFTGRYSENYMGTGRDLPIWVASFALMDYGTGIVGCSAHDERDWKFAKKYDLPLHPVLFPSDKELAEKVRKQEVFYREPDGILEEPKKFAGMRWDKARESIINYIVENGCGRKTVNYKLRDWVFSRQRYWGEPIPLVHCEACKNRKYHYVLVHGYYDGVDFAWLLWAKNELEQAGHTVTAIDLPNPKHPIVDEQVDFLLKKTEINENTILVGHSLGGNVVMRLLEKTNKKVAKVVFVDGYIRPDFVDKRRPDLEGGCNWKFDFDKIKKLSKKFVILSDKNYPVITPGQDKELADLLDGELVSVSPIEPHFRAKEELEVLRQLFIDGWSPIPEKDLPLELPKVKHYEPSGTGESPLANIDKWVNTKCPVCGGPAKRETNTMPQWAGSCWYYLAYTMPKVTGYRLQDTGYKWDKDKINYWNPVDLYVGGAEHATRHLIYARFWHKFLYDIGAVGNSEPFTRLQNVGLILAEDGRKMSKRWGNVINPDDVVREYGADAMRLYEMFMGPFDQPCAWSMQGLVGMRRFLERVWALQSKVQPSSRAQVEGKSVKSIKSEVDCVLHQTIKKVTEDIEGLRFNTAISQLMILVNEMSKCDRLQTSDFSILLQLLSPFAPHIAEELWSQLGNKISITKAEWPKYDPELAKEDKITIAVQINGKLRDTFEVPAEIGEKEVKKMALESEKVQKWLGGKNPRKVIYVKGKLVSIVL